MSVCLINLNTLGDGGHGGGGGGRVDAHNKKNDLGLGEGDENSEQDAKDQHISMGLGR